MIKVEFFFQKTITEYVQKDQKYIIDYLHNPQILLKPLTIMATKIVCDSCGKDYPEDQCYELKVKSNSTKAVLSSDLCHGCFLKADQNPIDKIPKKWKKWNTDQRAYVDVSP